MMVRAGSSAITAERTGDGDSDPVEQAYTTRIDPSSILGRRFRRYVLATDTAR